MSVVGHTRVSGAARSLLELDPELGQLLTPERREAAEHELRVRVSSFPVGEWDGGRLADADPMHLGLLIADGVLAREVVLGENVSTELLGPGDILRPWHIEGPPELLVLSVRWNALSPVRLGLIDRRATTILGRFPEIGAVIVDRLSERAHRLAVTQAISQLNRVDRRLLALFWHLAERWGRVARDGIAVPLALSHRLIGELVGARRPTVSTALAELARDGQLTRRDDGTWLLTGEPVAVPGAHAADVVRQRRRLQPRVVETQQPAEPESRSSGPSGRAAVVAGGSEGRGRAPPREPRRPAGGDRRAAPAHGRAARPPPALRRRAARGRRPAAALVLLARRVAFGLLVLVHGVQLVQVDGRLVALRGRAVHALLALVQPASAVVLCRLRLVGGVAGALGRIAAPAASVLGALAREARGLLVVALHRLRDYSPVSPSRG